MVVDAPTSAAASAFPASFVVVEAVELRFRRFEAGSITVGLNDEGVAGRKRRKQRGRVHLHNETGRAHGPTSLSVPAPAANRVVF